MQPETLNIFLVVFAGLNIVVLVLALRIVWKYTGEIEKIKEALTPISARSPEPI